MPVPSPSFSRFMNMNDGSSPGSKLHELTGNNKTAHNSRIDIRRNLTMGHTSFPYKSYFRSRSRSISDVQKAASVRRGVVCRDRKNAPILREKAAVRIRLPAGGLPRRRLICVLCPVHKLTRLFQRKPAHHLFDVSVPELPVVGARPFHVSEVDAFLQRKSRYLRFRVTRPSSVPHAMYILGSFLPCAFTIFRTPSDPYRSRGAFPDRRRSPRK